MEINHMKQYLVQLLKLLFLKNFVNLLKILGLVMILSGEIELKKNLNILDQKNHIFIIILFQKKFQI